MSQSASNDELQTRFELKTVLETSRMLIESRKSDFVLNNLLLIVMGKLLTTKAAILLHNPGRRDNYTLQKARGVTRFSEGDSLRFELDPNQKKHPHFYYRDYSDSIPPLIDNMENTLFFPLRTSNHHLGFLFIDKKATGKPYTEHELEFVESLCIISSVAIANSQLFDELKATNRKLDRRIHELNTLFDLSKEFNLLADRNKITQIFKFALLGQLFVRTFFLIYKTPEKLSLLVSSGLTTSPNKIEIDSIFEECPVDVLPIEEDCLERHPTLKKNEIAHLIGISIQNEKVAVIGVGERVNGEPFTETDFNFLKSLCNLAIVSIQKTYFIEDRIDKERMEEELSIAKSIQQGLLPNPVPKIPGIDLAAQTISSHAVGGDYFDVATAPDNNTIFAIADVTGKGVPAALLMANLQSMLHVLLPVDITLAEATERINNIIFRNTPSDKFITFFWGKYIHKQSIFRYVNAGHNPPLLLRKDTDLFEELGDGGLLLGALESMTPYEQTDINLNAGDLLVCYTDGVNEAMESIRQEEYGEKRLMECIRLNREKTSRQILEAIVKDVRNFADGSLQDDLTLLIIKADG